MATLKTTPTPTSDNQTLTYNTTSGSSTIDDVQTPLPSDHMPDIVIGVIIGGSVLLVVIVIIITIVVVIKQRKDKRKHTDVLSKNNKAIAAVTAKADNSAVSVPMLYYNQSSLQDRSTGSHNTEDDNDADDGVYLIPEAPPGLAVNTTVVTTLNKLAYSRETTLNNTGCDDEDEYLLPVSTNTPKNQNGNNNTVQPEAVQNQQLTASIRPEKLNIGTTNDETADAVYENHEAGAAALYQNLPSSQHSSVVRKEEAPNTPDYP